MSRDYKKEYDEYHAKPEQIKRRASRNKARAHMIKNGRAHKGDGKEVDHRNHNPLDNSPENIRMRDKRANRRDQ